MHPALWGGAGLAVALPTLLIGGGALAIALPNPLRALKTHGHPHDDGLPVIPLTLADGSAAWLVGPPLDAGFAVCLAHGRSRDKSYLRPLIAALAAHVPVLAFDFPGHGERRFGWCSLGDREAQVVSLALNALVARGARRVVCYGVSMGGAATLISQARAPNPAVQAIVTDGAFASVEQVIQASRPRLLPPAGGRLALRVAGRLAGYDPFAVRPEDAAARLRVPLHVLHGDADPLVPVAAAARIAEAAGTTPVIYPGRHDEPHNPAMQAQVCALVEQYAARPERSAS